MKHVFVGQPDYNVAIAFGAGLHKHIRRGLREIGMPLFGRENLNVSIFLVGFML